MNACILQGYIKVIVNHSKDIDNVVVNVYLSIQYVNTVACRFYSVETLKNYSKERKEFWSIDLIQETRAEWIARETIVM